MIDGLGEFEGDHRPLIEPVRGVNKFLNVKLYISSRPWNVFRNAFMISPNLQIQHLTKRDIILKCQVPLSMQAMKGIRKTRA